MTFRTVWGGCFGQRKPQIKSQAAFAADLGIMVPMDGSNYRIALQPLLCN